MPRSCPPTSFAPGRDSRLSVIPETRSAQPHAFAMKRAVSLHFIMYQFEQKGSEHLVSLLISKRYFISGQDGIYPYDATHPHICSVSYIVYVSFNSSSTCGNTTYSVLLLLSRLAAAVRLHRAGIRAWSRCVVFYPRIWSRRILYRYFAFVQDFLETRIQAAAA